MFLVEGSYTRTYTFLMNHFVTLGYVYGWGGGGRTLYQSTISLLLSMWFAMLLRLCFLVWIASNFFAVKVLHVPVQRAARCEVCVFAFDCVINNITHMLPAAKSIVCRLYRLLRGVRIRFVIAISMVVGFIRGSSRREVLANRLCIC